MTDLEIIEPTEKDFRFFTGASKTVTYKVKNNTEFKIKDIEATAYTALKDDSTPPKYTRTKDNYAKVISTPKEIYPNKSEDLGIEVIVPAKYDEWIRKSDGKMHKEPFIIFIEVKSVKYIEEI